MDERSRFYAERDLRSRELGLQAPAAELSIGIAIGENAWQREAQVAVLALCNLAARTHRDIHLAIPQAPLLARSLLVAADLREAAVLTIMAIDPYCRVKLVDDVRHVSNSVAVGENVSPARWYLGAAGYHGILSESEQSIEPNSLVGASMAACLGAAALFTTAHGHPVRARRVSAWDCTEGFDDTHAQVPSIIDVGSVLVIGGGAVASALQYWLQEFQVTGTWSIVDGDLVELHNTARGMCMFARHAGWAGVEKSRKVDVFAAAGTAAPFFGWYDQWVAANDRARPDLILPLANERGVREAIAHRHEPVVLHATTSRSWQAQFHRHISGVDDCIACRVRGVATPTRFGCSSAPVGTSSEVSNDAALPFLSGAAGLFLLCALLRLQDGSLYDDAVNQWSLDFLSTHRATQRSRRACLDDCIAALPDTVRQNMTSKSRWANLRAVRKG
ncbi:MAG TPA: hypothetical protein VHO25_09590 [Polyangiaceae bacterium]|nr:hypothetical protein [Polyangiaceae bacterium]